MTVQPKDVIGTYLKGFLLTPALLLLPPGLMIWLIKMFNGPVQPPKGQPADNSLAVGFGLGFLIYWALVVSSILDLASGRRAARLATELTADELEVVGDDEEQ